MNYDIYSFFNLEQKVFRVNNLNDIINIFLTYSIQGIFSIDYILTRNYRLKKIKVHNTKNILKIIGRKIHKNLIIETDSMLDEVKKRYDKK